MRPLTINIILPFPVTKPVGGAKIMYEYANRLAAKGHKVSVFHAVKRPYKKSSTPTWVKWAIYMLRGVSRPKWFPLDERIKSVIVPAITDKYIPDADIVISTWWQMTYAVNELAASKGKKFNLIQDYEIWRGLEDKVHNSYSLPVNHLVIAKYLQKLVFDHSGVMPVHIPNAIEGKKFFVQNPPQQREQASLIMLYSEEPRKGTPDGIAALKLVKEAHPEFKATFFGVYQKPADLPEWISYHYRPANLVELYIQAAIFFSPSLGEGWALPPAEAMACGCAVVCTNIGGHLDYAIENETALLAEPKAVAEMAQKIGSLINDLSLRLKLAEGGSKLMSTQFSWENSVQKLKDCFYKSL
jgi:glycosyltransferase involved in cell wall biosynthesis